MIRCVAALALLAATGVFAQSFEVASIKPNNSGTGNSSTYTNRGELRMENASLKKCVELAFDVRDYSLSAPDWLDSARFDIIAKPPSGTPQREFPAMLQALLVERFKLAFHREEKVLPAYALIVDKKGAKIHPVEDGGSSGTSTSQGRLTTQRVPMSVFADHLSRQLDRPVKDLTELKGVFDLKLEWTPDESAAASDTPAGPAIFSALQEQLGLRLEARRLPVQILVVDHVERVPTEN